MNKGILIVDGQRNVLLVHPDESDYLIKLMRSEVNKDGEGIISRVKKHKTNKELDATIHKYLKQEYDDEKEEEDDRIN